MRTRGSGLYGCGPANGTSHTILEGLRIVLDAINSGRAKPKIGVRLMDSCGRKRVAVDLLAKMFPELQTGVDDPPLPQSRRLAGLVDGAGLADDAGDAGAALLAARVAVAPLREWLPVAARVKALIAVVRHLRWERVVVLRSGDEDADDALWREWTAAQAKDGPCVVAVERNASAALAHALPVVVLVPQVCNVPCMSSRGFAYLGSGRAELLTMLREKNEHVFCWIANGDAYMRLAVILLSLWHISQSVS